VHPKIKTLFVFRHGQTDWNLNRRLQGSTDIPLNQTGREQALVLKKFFSEKAVDLVLSSDLCRARETAEIAFQGSTTSMVLMRELRENCLGEAEGLTFDEVAAHFGAEAWEHWSSCDPAHTHFAFPGGESKFEHVQRVLNALEAFLLDSPHARFAVATHGGTLRRLIHHLRADLTEPVWINNCGLYELSFNTIDRSWQVDLEMKCGV
jgi:broad specificity phosphatase PhoE